MLEVHLHAGGAIGSVITGGFCIHEVLLGGCVFKWHEVCQSLCVLIELEGAIGSWLCWCVAVEVKVTFYRPEELAGCCCPATTVVRGGILYIFHVVFLSCLEGVHRELTEVGNLGFDCSSVFFYITSYYGGWNNFVTRQWAATSQLVLATRCGSKQTGCCHHK